MNNFRLGIFIYVLHQFNGERTIYGLYHLLKGKKTSQTIQDAKIYHIEKLFGTMKSLKREDVSLEIKNGLQLGWLEKRDTDTYILSKSGENQLVRFLQEKPLPKHLNGYKYHEKGITFWHRFSLFTQSLSNVLVNKFSFIPITTNEQVHGFVKRLFPVKEKRQKIANGVFAECVTLLSQLPDEQANIFIRRLSSANKIGLTIEQISQKLKKDETEVSLKFQNTLHYIVGEVLKYPEKYPNLEPFVHDFTQLPIMTKTANITFNLLKSGKSFDEIMKIRRLKKSTIEDHIVEIASNVSSFSIEPFVTKDNEKKILDVVAKRNTKKLKDLKVALNCKDITFFQIRLVLAKKEYKHELRNTSST